MKNKVTITSEYDGCEIQRYLRKELLMSSVMVKRLKLYGTVNLNGVHARIRDTIAEGDELFIEYEDSTYMLNHPADVQILFEDDHYAVINKPSGMVTHPTHGHLDDSLITQLSDRTLHPVMRLDRETSGLIIIAKDGYSHNTIHSYGNIEKSYKALCYGHYNPECGTIDVPIARREGSVMIRDCTPDGKPSVTEYKTLEYIEDKDISLVEFRLLTGRCHQIRTHSRYMGHPLLGDGLYGPNSEDNPSQDFPGSMLLDEKIGRVALHAYRLSFYDPFAGITRTFETDIPSDMKEILNQNDSQSSRARLSEESL